MRVANCSANMGDFLGSYYTNFVEDEGMSGAIALLRAEEPVSVLDMEKLLSPRRSQEISNESDIPNSRSSVERMAAIDKLQIREVKEMDFGGGTSRPCSLDGPDLEIPVASMSLFEQDSMMVSVQLRSLRDDLLKGSSTDHREPDERRGVMRIRSRSSTELRQRPVETLSPRAQTTDFEINSLTSKTDGSVTPKTPRTGDMLLSVAKRTSKLKSSMFNLIGRKKKKHESTSKRK